MEINFIRLNHIQLCIPKNKEEEARSFYCELVGLKEIEKPVDLRKNGGFWLKIADIELHIGAEDVFNKSKRHPAFEITKINTIKEELRAKGIRLKEDKSLPKHNRFSFYDPFNNRIELLEEKSVEELEFLGKEVTIKIDRPIKSKHPKHPFVYELNYGYLPNTKSGDGQPIDAYIIGPKKSIEEFKGVVKAVIIRYDDSENKLVVTDANHKLSESEVLQETLFQEQYFDTEIRMIED